MRALCLCLRRGKHKKIQTSFSNASARARVCKSNVNHFVHYAFWQGEIKGATNHASRHGECRTSHTGRFEIAWHTSRGATCKVATKRRVCAVAQTRPAHRWFARPMRDRCVHVRHFASARQETLPLVALHKATQGNDGGARKASINKYAFSLKHK